MYIRNNTLSSKVSRFMAVHLTDENENDITLNVESPKLKTYKKFQELDNNAQIDEIIDIISCILSKNREHKTITAEFIEDTFDTDDMLNFFEDFTAFIAENKNSPN